MTPRSTPHTDDVKRAARWLADCVPDGNAKPLLPTIVARFGLTDADAAEAILLAGNYSLCRRAFA